MLSTVIIPPDPDLQTDEEFDNDILSDFEMPYDVPGTIEIHHNDEHSEDPIDEPKRKKTQTKQNKTKNRFITKR